MDVCCLARPFDDQSQDKIRLEAEAVISVLKRCEDRADWELTGSDVISLEISKNNDPVKKKKVLLLYESASESVEYDKNIKTRAEEFQKSGVKPFDSMHLASAESAMVDVFLTTDNKLLKAAARTDIKIRVENPLSYYTEVLNDEQTGV